MSALGGGDRCQDTARARTHDTDLAGAWQDHRPPIGFYDLAAAERLLKYYGFQRWPPILETNATMARRILPSFS